MSSSRAVSVKKKTKLQTILSPNLLCFEIIFAFYYSSVGLIQQLKIKQEGWQERPRQEGIQSRLQESCLLNDNDRKLIACDLSNIFKE
jgi:hypothetical protein